MSATNVGKLNVYVCDGCKDHITTEDVDDGVTPMMVRCKATEKCLGLMMSRFYQPQRFPSNRKPAEWEWYRPEKAELATKTVETQKHVQRGGLLLRKKSE